MQFTPTDIPDVVIITPQVFGDERGFFMETWRHALFMENNISYNFVQFNHSRSAKGILRGLHYQLQHPQGKLVRTVSGEIFDVAVDLRVGSHTFGRWVGAVLSQENKKSLFIPPGFAHGFYVLSESADVIYHCTDYYHSASECSILWNDTDLNITWPLQAEPLLSAKDARGVPFKKARYFTKEMLASISL